MTGAILDHLWQSTVIALLIGVLTLLFRNNSASVRHGLWLTASIKFLFPFSILVFLGRTLFIHTVTDSSIKIIAKVETITVPFAAAVPVLVKPETHELPWTTLAIAIWAVGFAAIVTYWCVQWIRLAATVRSAKPATIDAPVPVRITPESLEPGLVGIVHPVILLPDSMAQRLASYEIDAILAHELCHLRRRDNFLTLIHMLVEAVFWFYPLVWFIGSRLIEESERACDDAVLDTGRKPLLYAQTILKVCRLTFRSQLPCASGISGSDLDRRITAIMGRRGIDDVDPNKILLLIGLVVFAVLVPFVTGGLAASKVRTPAPTVHALQSLVQGLAIERPVRQLATEVPDKFRPPRHHSVRHLSSAFPLPTTIVSTPAIQVDTLIIIPPVPQLVAEDSGTTSADAIDAPVCRPPQRLAASRLMGPQVCLPKQTWDRYKAQGLVLMPDGRTFATAYNPTKIPASCMSTGATASHPGGLIPTCPQ